MKFLNNLVSNYLNKTTEGVSEGISNLSENSYVKNASIALMVAGIVYALYFFIQFINEIFLLKKNIKG